MPTLCDDPENDPDNLIIDELEGDVTAPDPDEFIEGGLQYIDDSSDIVPGGGIIRNIDGELDRLFFIASD